MLLAGQSALGQDAIQPVADTVKIGRDSSYWGQRIRLPWDYTISRKYYAGAISSITGEEMARFRVANNSNMLAGRLAGLKTSMGSEEPGYDASSLYIRGTNSYNNSNMYVYVDNIPVGFNQLDPLEIDQLVVLKDAAAAGTYGIRGANKGLAVTTRRGEIGKGKINFYSQVGFLAPMSDPDYLGAKDYMTLYNEAAANDGLPARFSDAQIAAYNDPNRDKQLYPDVNWYDELIKNQALQQKYNLTFSGGTKDVRYFVLLGYMNQQGLYKYSDLNEKKLGYNTNAGFKRYNFRSNLDFNINPSLVVALDLAGRLEVKNFPGSSQSSIWGNIALYPPNLFPMLYDNGKIGGNQQYTRNPYGLLTQTGYTREVHRNLSSTARIEQKLDKWIKGLSVVGAFAHYNYYYNTEGAVMDFATWELQPGGDYKQFGTDVAYNFRNRTQSQERMNTVWAKVDYKTSFGPDHDFAAHVGFNQSVTTPAGDDFPYATQGFFGRSYYAYKKKYIAELNMGYNGSENLAPGKRYGFFPSLALAWLISEEKFLQNDQINLLKLRASYGILGNADFGNNFGTGRNRYLYTSSYTSGAGYTFGRNPGGVGSRTEGDLANPDITWETLYNANIGVDMAFFGNKLGASIDVFHEKRKDILAVPSSLSSLIGIGVKAFNIGEMENKGIDWDIYYKDQVGDFGFTVHALGTYSRNKIIYQDEAILPYAYLYRTGNPLGTPFGLQALGFFKDQQEINNSPVQTFSQVKPGDIKYKDQNGDNRIDIYDEVPLGKPSGNPELYYGASVELRYKGFDLTVWFQGTGSRDVNVMNFTTMGFAGGSKPTSFALNRWTPATAATAGFPRLSTTAKVAENNYRNSDFWLQDGKYLRLKNVEIGYNFSTGLIRKLHLSQARIYVSGFNLYTWTKLKPDYIDPEFTGAGIGSYPRTRSMHFGINLQF